MCLVCLLAIIIEQLILTFEEISFQISGPKLQQVHVNKYKKISNFPHNGTLIRKGFPCYDIIMLIALPITSVVLLSYQMDSATSWCHDEAECWVGCPPSWTGNAVGTPLKTGRSPSEQETLPRMRVCLEEENTTLHFIQKPFMSLISEWYRIQRRKQWPYSYLKRGNIYHLPFTSWIF